MGSWKQRELHCLIDGKKAKLSPAFRKKKAKKKSKHWANPCSELSATTRVLLCTMPAKQGLLCYFSKICRTEKWILQCTHWSRLFFKYTSKPTSTLCMILTRPLTTKGDLTPWDQKKPPFPLWTSVIVTLGQADLKSSSTALIMQSERSCLHRHHEPKCLHQHLSRPRLAFQERQSFCHNITKHFLEEPQKILVFSPLTIFP